DDAGAKCRGVLATLDMDGVMASEREWGCYPQVPGLGICQPARHDGIDAVLVTPWRWDGRERRRAEQGRGQGKGEWGGGRGGGGPRPTPGCTAGSASPASGWGGAAPGGGRTRGAPAARGALPPARR